VRESEQLVNIVLDDIVQRISRRNDDAGARGSNLICYVRDKSSGLSGAELANRAGVTPQSISTAIGSLLERGLVVRTPHPTHGRVLEVRITAEGTRLLERARAAAKTVEDRALAQLSAEEHDQLSSLIHKVMQTLDIHVTERS